MKWLNKLEDLVCGIMILVAVLVLMVHIFLRYFLNSGFPWTEELIRLMFIWITFIGIAINVRKNSNINIDLINNLLKNKGKLILGVITDIISIVFVIILGLAALQQVQFSLAHPQYLTALRWPIYLIYLPIPVGCLLMLVHYMNRFINFKETYANKS